MLPIILKALAVGLLVCLCCSLLGTSLVLKRFSMIGDGLSHTGFGALAVASVMGATGAAYHITVPIVTITAFFLLRTGENSKIRGDTAIAVLSTGAVAFGSLLFNFDPHALFSEARKTASGRMSILVTRTG
ncbi:MAG: metal ABC transporter permease, partial [Clostridia bacterium]|nr:metal ABC transporter permease [Clostridia bacterium]